MSEKEGVLNNENNMLGLFADETDDSVGPSPQSSLDIQTWKILIVDDEASVHEMTERVLGDFTYENRGLTFLHAYSGKEAKKVLKEKSNIAMVLLDVVMESDDAGFEVIKYIRDKLNNNFIQIILRTGQPGQAPEQKVITEFNINDYKSKVELTVAKLYISVMSSLRAYQLAHSLHIGILERKRAQEALRFSEERYRLLVENAHDAIFITQDGAIRFHNQKTEELLGYSGNLLTRTTLMKYFHTDGHEQLQFLEVHPDERTAFEIQKKTLRMVTKEDQELWIELRSVPIVWEGVPSYLNFMRDITKQRMLEEQIVQSQKMEAIGTLAGGIAHDFNNILLALIGYTELAIFDIPPGNRAKEFMETVLMASNRAAALVRQILSFTRRDDQKKKPVIVSGLVREVLKLMRSSLPATIEIRQTIEKQDGSVLANPTQIHQVIMNLCTNASYAMRLSGGVLEVQLMNVEIDSATASFYSDLKPGPYLKLSITDTGEGMSPEVKERIFEPFYSTKPRDKGTGLGLSVVHGIVKNHDGAITVYSEVGKGTTFTLFLLRKYGDQFQKADDSVLTSLPRGTERILCVDDEEQQLQMSKKMLEWLGYKVTDFLNPEEALAHFKASPADFDLIFTDMTMPELTGAEFSMEVLKIQPKMPVILCTGYSGYITEKIIKNSGIKACVIKPIAIDELAETLRRVLDELNTDNVYDGL